MLLLFGIAQALNADSEGYGVENAIGAVEATPLYDLGKEIGRLKTLTMLHRDRTPDYVMITPNQALSAETSLMLQKVHDHPSLTRLENRSKARAHMGEAFDGSGKELIQIASVLIPSDEAKFLKSLKDQYSAVRGQASAEHEKMLMEYSALQVKAQESGLEFQRIDRPQQRVADDGSEELEEDSNKGEE